MTSAVPSERLRAPSNWLRQGNGPYKDTVNEYDALREVAA
jgi:hypothetical protein